jgi:hypothetical protein
VIECPAAMSDEVVHWAAPAESGSEMQPGIAAPLSLNVTVPEGVPELPVSVAIKVTAWPAVDGLSVEAMLNVDTATPVLTVWLNAVDVPGR